MQTKPAITARIVDEAINSLCFEVLPKNAVLVHNTIEEAINKYNLQFDREKRHQSIPALLECMDPSELWITAFQSKSGQLTRYIYGHNATFKYEDEPQKFFAILEPLMDLPEIYYKTGEIYTRKFENLLLTLLRRATTSIDIELVSYLNGGEFIRCIEVHYDWTALRQERCWTKSADHVYERIRDNLGDNYVAP